VRFDDFTRPGSLYFLSHFHGDHMRGLARGSDCAPIVASPETALLASRIKKIPRESFVVIAAGERRELAAPLSMRIEAIEANHCPGALMFAIECEAGRMLYTGDFRLNDAMRAAARALSPVDLLVADNTYDAPRYRFPSQEEAVERVVAIAERHAREREVAIAIYSIGKTRILEALRARLGLPVYVGAKTARIYTLLGRGDLVTRDRATTPLRGYARGYFDRYFKMKREYREGRAVAIIPTGWAVDVRRPEWNFHYVPYSEHCDYHERAEFVAALRPARVEFLLEEERFARALESTPGAAPGRSRPAAAAPLSLDIFGDRASTMC
jgi:hypothetical protein